MSEAGSSPARVRVRLPLLDEVLVVALPPGTQAREAIVLRDGEGTLRAYQNLCRHMPIPLDAGGRRFLDETAHIFCSTHGARYRREDGECVSGPCKGRRLFALDVTIEGEDALVEPPSA